MRISKVLRISTVGAVVASAACFGVTSASATVVGSGGCGGTGSVATYYNVPSGTWESYDIGNGTLSVEYINNYSGIDVEYYKSAGSAITADFVAWPFDSYEIKDQGSFSESAGQLKSYAWNGLGLLTGTCTVAGIDVVGQGYFTITISS